LFKTSCEILLFLPLLGEAFSVDVDCCCCGSASLKNESSGSSSTSSLLQRIHHIKRYKMTIDIFVRFFDKIRFLFPNILMIWLQFDSFGLLALVWASRHEH
jgi:hypothetical protein